MLRDSGQPFSDYVDAKTGTVDRIIFSDEDIYQLELERIFARTWNFMCHESQIPNPGDFFLSFIGEESVIATRDKRGGLQVFLNSCRHRGNAVCRAEEGNTRSFLCTYHGWTYDLEGKLIGVPGYKDLYHERLDRSQWGLISAGKVGSYKGFVFATMDPDAPDLDVFLGDVGRMSLDLIAERGDEMIVVRGVQKNQVGCNWKLAVDNVFDWYHAQITHASAFLSDFRRPPTKTLDGRDLPPQASTEALNVPQYQRVLLGDYGHAISGPRTSPRAIQQKKELAAKGGYDPRIDDRWRDRPQAVEALGEVGQDVRGHPNIFPNLWVSTSSTQLSLRLPKGPGLTEIWWFTLLPKDVPEAEMVVRMRNSNHVFGPAGMLEQDDGENWDQSTRATAGVVARRYPLNFAMNLGRGEPSTPAVGPRYIDTHINEHAQLWTYRAWAVWMDAENWAALKDNAATAPTEAV